ncbi:MAG: rhomboid family intramembrane serine protease [Chloroflexi bacterium]|nr:rhomboid family intramembrane serine protease [Chloroflexota bacterium]
MFPISDRDLKRRSFPFVNVSLIAACAVVFIYELTLSGTDRDVFFFQFGLIPSELANGADYGLLATPLGYEDIATPGSNWATMFTSMFIHGDWMHFLGNMLFLWVFGDNVEDRFGHFRYLLFYVAAGVAAGWLQIATDTTSQIPTIGASGAIAGVLGAYLILYPRSRVDTLIFFILITVVRIPAVFLLGFWIFLQFMEGLGSLGLEGGGIAYWAHIGGFIFGVGVAFILVLLKGRGPPTGERREVKYWRGRPIDY